jgi:hypothetical protein
MKQKIVKTEPTLNFDVYWMFTNSWIYTSVDLNKKILLSNEIFRYELVSI